MELSFVMRLRIAAAAAVGIVVIGIIGWPLTQPADPSGVVSLAAGAVSITEAVTCVGLAVLVGVIAYFFSWPYGREIASVAVPAGLGVWAIRSGKVAGLMQQNPSAVQRYEILHGLGFEASFWVLAVLAGLLGVFIAQKLVPAGEGSKATPAAKARLSKSIGIVVITLVGSVLVGQFCIKLLAQDVRVFDTSLGWLTGQPAIGQTCFAVAVAFGIVGFAAKKLLGVGYVWPIISTGLVSGFIAVFYAKQDMLDLLCQRAGAVFFGHAGLAILPVQMVAFGSLGAIGGYWLAVRFEYRHKHVK